ncbi:MAG: hypothetical protein LBK41_02520, partial [Clostridiales bacterium]|nr:hypothetical protein [Clostridiales bacterium]
MKKHAAKLLAAGFAGTLALSPPCEAMAAVKWDGSRFSVYNDSGGLTAVTDDIDEAYRAETALAAPSPAVGDTAKFLGLLDGILTKVVGAGMSEDEKVRAVYEFLMFQFAHNGERLRSNGRAIEMPDTSLGTLRLGA